MKIAMFGQKQVPSRDGGIEVAVTELCLRMAEAGHTVCCYNRGGKRGVYRGIRLRPVMTIPGKGVAAVSSSFFAAVASSLSRAQVVHIHGEGPAFWSWIPKLAGKRVVVTIHGLDWQREKWNALGKAYLRLGEKAAVRFADSLIVLSRHTQRYFQEAYGRKSRYMANGGGVFRPRKPEEMEKFGLKKEDYFLFLGRLVPEKEVHTLIAAFRQVKTEKKLVIAGKASDTERYVSRLKDLAKGDERILFAGFAEGNLLEELYSNAYVYVLPSRVEGMPLSLLEAMGYGCCCLISDIPECTEVAGQRGISFPTGDGEALKRLLQQLCCQPELVERCRKAPANFVSWEAVMQQTLECYHADFAD